MLKLAKYGSITAIGFGIGLIDRKNGSFILFGSNSPLDTPESQKRLKEIKDGKLGEAIKHHIKVFVSDDQHEDTPSNTKKSSEDAKPKR